MRLLGTLPSLLVLSAIMATEQSTPQAPLAQFAGKGITPPPANSEAASCRGFVNDFYNWYWNSIATEAKKPGFNPKRLHSYHDVVRRKPAVLSDELLRLIQKDEAASKAAGGEIVHLDFDPFLNSQDPEGKYLISTLTAQSGHCMVKMNQRHIRAELEHSAAGWLFINFYYGNYSEDDNRHLGPDYDLLTLLRR